MTDNRKTELLRKLLDERGVEYTTNDHMGAYETSWNGFTATQLSSNANLIMAVTPEQAIAATLGSGTLREVCQNGGKGAAAQALQPLLKEPGDIGGTPLLELGV